MLKPKPNHLRVCQVGKFYPPAPGGIETYVHTLANFQVPLQVQTTVVCMNHRPGPTVTDQEGEVTVIRASRRLSVAKMDFCPGLVRTLRKVSADVIHLHVPNPTMILALLMARLSTPLVVTYHSDHVRQKIRGALFRPFEQRLYPSAKALLPTSEAYVRGSEILQQYRNRVRVVPIGLDLDAYLNPSAVHLAEAEAIRKKYGTPLWLACGRLIYYKGLEYGLRALKNVPGKLLIIGQGPDRQRLEEEARQLGVADRAVFLGGVPFGATIPYFLAATAFWFPSNARSEAFGVVQVEAMASGCPVINTDIPHSGVTWVCPHEDSGLTVPVNNPQAFAAAANRLVQSPSFRDQLGARARSRARAEFGAALMAERVLAVYREVT